MTYNKNILRNLKKFNLTIYFANGDSVKSEYIGQYIGYINSNKIILNDVLYIPSFKRNLLSIDHLVDQKYKIIFNKYNDKKYVSIYDAYNNKVCSASANKNKTYKICTTLKYINYKNSNCNAVCNSLNYVTHQEEINTWHRRLAHANIDNLINKLCKIPIKYKCKVCAASKMKNMPYYSSQNNASEPFQLIHMDLVQSPDYSIYGNKYFLTILDDYSRYGWVIFIDSKEKVFDSFLAWYRQIVNIFNKTIKYIRSDNGPEFINKSFKDFFDKNGIIHQDTVAYTPQQNGRVERLHGTLISWARAILEDAKLSRRFWEDAISTANYIRNRLPHKGINNKVPYEVLFNKKVNYSIFRVFGCQVFYYVPKQFRKKYDNTTSQGIFLGYHDTNNTAYKIYDFNTNKIIISKVVEFFENVPGNIGAPNNIPELIHFSNVEEVDDNTYNNKNQNITNNMNYNNNLNNNNIVPINPNNQKFNFYPNNFTGQLPINIPYINVPNLFPINYPSNFINPQFQNYNNNNYKNNSCDNNYLVENNNNNNYFQRENDYNFQYGNNEFLNSNFNNYNINKNNLNSSNLNLNYLNNNLYNNSNNNLNVNNNKQKDNYENNEPNNYNINLNNEKYKVNNNNLNVNNKIQNQNYNINNENLHLQNVNKEHNAKINKEHNAKINEENDLNNVNNTKDINNSNNTGNVNDQNTKKRRFYDNEEEILNKKIKSFNINDLLQTSEKRKFTNNENEEEANKRFKSYNINKIMEINNENNYLAVSNINGIDIYALLTVDNKNLKAPINFKDIFNKIDKREWLEAVDNELNNMRKMNVYTPVENIPEGANVITPRWIFTYKLDENGNLMKRKARIVARGCSQQEGVDFFKTFSPTLRQDSFRIFISFAVQNKFTIHQMDIKAAYLNAKLQEEIYMKLPEGEDASRGKYCKLNKALYGLKQAGRMWNETLNNVLLKLKFKRLLSEPCLYVKKDREGKALCIMAVYVDDILIAGKEDEIKLTKTLLKENFEATDTGEVNFIIGIKFEKLKDGYLIHQKRYLNEIFEKFEIYKYKECANMIPIENEMLKKKSFNPTKYRQAIGSLLYLAICTRPDITIFRK